MQLEEFRASLSRDSPRRAGSARALWWDAKGDWARAHGLVDELETPEGMAVHAYLHRKEGVEWNAEYWYRRAGHGSIGRGLKRSGRRWWRGWVSEQDLIPASKIWDTFCAGFSRA